MKPIIHKAKITDMIDNVLNNSLSDFLGTDFTNNIPSVNITESDDNYVIQLAAPGKKKDVFDIQIDKDQLFISITEKSESKEEDVENNFLRKEFNYSNFKRSFHIPQTVDRNKIEAKYEEGILFVSLPKKEDSKEPKAKAIKIS